MVRQKPTSIPAVPQQPSAEHYQFASALKQNSERHDRVLAEQAADLDMALQYSAGELPTVVMAAGQAWQPNPKDGFLQKVMNKGAHTLQPPTENCMMTLLYYNTTTAGVITVTGFTKVTGTSAPPSNGTTAGNIYMARITVILGKSWLEWVALQ
jgi:hypothetical protein